VKAGGPRPSVVWPVHLAWSRPLDTDVAGYRIYRAVDEGPFALAGTVPAVQATWTDSSVEPGRRYRYTVTAIDSAAAPNESERSEVVETTIPGPGSAAGRRREPVIR